MDEIGVALVGFGLGGRVFHSPFIKAVPGLKLRAIVQRHGDEAHNAHPEVRVYRSAVDVLQDKSIDLVVISTPHETHYQLAKQALLAGKHVVVDKPFTATSAEARELIIVAKDKKLVLAPFHNRRWDGDFKTVRTLLRRGDLGRLVTFESHFDRYQPLLRQSTWKENPHRANGMVFDLASHLVDQIVALFGVPKDITAFVRSDRDMTSIDDAFDIVLHYPRMVAYCRASWLAAEPAPRFLLHGTRGSFRKWGVDPQEAALTAGVPVPLINDPREWLREPETDWGTLAIASDRSTPSALTQTKLQTEPGDYRDFYANVLNAILANGALAVSPEDGYRNVRLLELAHESSRARRTLSVDLSKDAEEDGVVAGGSLN